MPQSRKKKNIANGKLRIGDNWNAITIIALSQSNPLKAIAEFVENSIDARARKITITRGKEKGVHYIRIKDDGEGIQRKEDGSPDFQYVATHICDSVKRQLKRDGASGIQGEFGIGLLSFWTVGKELQLSSAGADGRTYHMHMSKGDPGYRISHRRYIVAEAGTELTIRHILPGIKQLSGEKMQWYLATELRDRIRKTGVQIKIVDRTSRAHYSVEPRKFEGRPLRDLEKHSSGRELRPELYLNQQDPAHRVALYRSGTRVVESITELPNFNQPPWNSGYLQGLIDAPYLNLTPGTRTGVIQDEALARLARELAPIEKELLRTIEEQQRAEEDRASKDVLRSIQRALKEALLALPAEEYDWFRVGKAVPRQGEKPPANGPDPAPGPLQTPANTAGDRTGEEDEDEEEEDEPSGQKRFFEYAGPLYSVRISPSSSVLPVNSERTLRAVARDRRRHLVEQDVTFSWEILEGEGELHNSDTEIATFRAAGEPGLTRIKVTARQEGVSCEAEAMITITESLIPKSPTGSSSQGIPGYTFQKAPGELWRSKYSADQNVVVINNGHRDFVFASRTKALKLRYICRLFSKELVLKNFAGAAPHELVERLIELSLYTEENLK